MDEQHGRQVAYSLLKSLSNFMLNYCQCVDDLRDELTQDQYAIFVLMISQIAAAVQTADIGVLATSQQLPEVEFQYSLLGRSVKEIAHDLGVSESSVKTFTKFYDNLLKVNKQNA
jgi:hypothetical protein